MLAHLVQMRRRHVLAITGRRPRIRTRLPKQIFPVGVEMAYRSTLLGLVASVRSHVERELFPSLQRAALEAQQLHRRDAVADDFAAVKISLLRGAFQTSNLKRLVEPVGQRTGDWQKAQLGRQLRAAVGVDVPIYDPRWSSRIAAFTEENVGLIQSIAEDSLGQVQKVALRGLAEGRRWEDLTDDIERRFDVTESRAALIARDQVGKFYGALNAARQVDAGITHFLWRTAGDERVRPEHVRLDGQRFAWNKPPSEGMPGQPINCRCNADPDVGALLDSLD